MTDFIELPDDIVESKLQPWANKKKKDYMIPVITSRYLLAYDNNQLSELPPHIITVLTNHSQDYQNLLNQLRKYTHEEFSTALQEMLATKTKLQLSTTLTCALTYEYYWSTSSQAEEDAFFAKYGINVKASEKARWTRGRNVCAQEESEMALLQALFGREAREGIRELEDEVKMEVAEEDAVENVHDQQSVDEVEQQPESDDSDEDEGGVRLPLS